jgi:hypothetical protein
MLRPADKTLETSVGSNGQPDVTANLTFTKFIFVLPHAHDAATLAKIRTAGATVCRGFFNDYDADGSREGQPHETIQFLLSDTPPRAQRDGIGAARYVIHVSANYRPRLVEVVCDFKRRIGDAADLRILDGAERTARYTSAEMRTYAYKPALSRQSGRAAANAVILPMSKTAEWWEKTPLERHAYFYPHHEDASGSPVKGHAKSAEAGIRKIFRRLYHNPDGYQRENEYDFITYFECTDENLPVFDEVCRALRDERQNPEWKYVLEGPVWRGKRVLRW